MNLCYPHDLPRVGIEKTYKHPVLTPLIIAIVLLAGVAAAAPQALSPGGGWFWWFLGGLFALATIYVLVPTWRILRSSNWLLKSTANGVYIKIGSLLDAHLDDPPIVIYLDFNEIESVGRVTQRLSWPQGKNKKETETFEFIDIHLKHTSTEALEEALISNRYLGVMGNVPYHDFPLRLIEPDLLRVDWEIVPGAEAAVLQLGAHCAIVK